MTFKDVVSKRRYNKKMWKTCLEDKDVLRKRRLHSNGTISSQREHFSSEFLIEHGYQGKRYVETLRGVAKHEWEISKERREVHRL